MKKGIVSFHHKKKVVSSNVSFNQSELKEKSSETSSNQSFLETPLEETIEETIKSFDFPADQETYLLSLVSKGNNTIERFWASFIRTKNLTSLKEHLSDLLLTYEEEKEDGERNLKEASSHELKLLTFSNLDMKQVSKTSIRDPRRNSLPKPVTFSRTESEIIELPSPNTRRNKSIS